MGGILYWLIVGLVAGILGKALMPGSANEPGGWIKTILLGIVGAFVGGFIASMLGFGTSGMLMQIIFAAIGAMLIIGLMRAVSGRRAV